MSRMFKFFVVLCIFVGANSQREGRQQIFFPREIKKHSPSCVAYDGQQGKCKLLVHCATFFAEIAELSRSPCKITETQQGVCCPPKKGPTKDPVSVAKSKPRPHNQAIFFPSVSKNDLNNACQNSLHSSSKQSEFEMNLVLQNIVAPPGSAASLHAKLFETTAEIIKKSKNAAIILGASNDLVKSLGLNKLQAASGLEKYSAQDTIVGNLCPLSSICPNPKYIYRTLDGSCNNLIQKDWGKTGATYTRLILPNYNDGIATARLSENGGSLPSARKISTVISPSAGEVYSNLTNLIWQWGQFLDHDVTHTPLSKGANSSDIICCDSGHIGSQLHHECMPIRIPDDDRFFAFHRQTCMNFVRSMPAFRADCKFGPREQMNQITAYIDASNVYGSTEEEARNLRSGSNGLLRVVKFNNQELLPANAESCSRGSARRPQDKCFLAGDTRVNEQPDLVVMHVVWLRQHNKVAKELHKLNPSWTDEILYHESRRIIGAQMQHITYNEYLPIVLGRNFMETYGMLPQESGYFTGYSADVDATILNSFTAAAFRYGHTLITDQLQQFNKFGINDRSDDLSSMQFIPFSLYERGTIDALIRGLTLQRSKKFDSFFSKELTNRLFTGGRAFGMDLVALNIQRGRDHGLPSYTQFREACDLPRINSWNGLLREGVILPKLIHKLQQAYASVHDIDLFVGGISEQVVRETLLGPTFLCIIGRQFIKLKIGDRFFYENGSPNLRNAASSFSEAQLEEIRKTSLARILCDNSENIEAIQPLAFITSHFVNARALCKSNILIPRVSLEPWTNENKWTK